MHLYNMVLGDLSVIMCKGTCNIHKSFAEYMTFSKMCMGLIFHGKKGNGNFTFLVYQTKLTFGKLIHQMVTVKDKIVTVKDRSPTLSVLYRYYCLLW